MSVVFDSQRFEAAGHVTGSSTGTLVTGGAANTKGASWQELIASTAFDAAAVTVQFGGVIGASASDLLLDIAVGAAGSEVVVLANLLTSYNANNSCLGVYVFPLSVPAGSRLSAKVQGTATNPAVRVAAGLYGQGFAQGSPLQHVTTYGAATADSGGTSVDPGGSANTLVWTQITASTSRDHSGFVVGLGPQNNITRTDCAWLFSLGVGAAASEQTLFSWQGWCDASSDTPTPVVTPFLPAVVPAGSRVAIGARCSIIDGSDRLLDAVVYGVS